MQWLKNRISNWLSINEHRQSMHIIEDTSLETEIFRNFIWYRGSISELSQLYSQSSDYINSNSFWSLSSRNSKIRKMHSGLPSLIVDTISSITSGDINSVNIFNKKAEEIWNKINKSNNFINIIKSATTQALYLGDGAFKISMDLSISKEPIIEFYGADKVRYEHKRGRISKIIFLKDIIFEKQTFVLEEIYSLDSIEYQLLDKSGSSVALYTLDETKDLERFENTTGVWLAYPLIFDNNPRFFGRGKSIFDGKLAIFDALDEILSQWVDAMRDGRVQKYIPIGLLPRNRDTGAAISLSEFDSRFVQTEMDLTEGAENQIRVVQPLIDINALQASTSNFIELALQGILAPASLGIDLKRRDNAEAQREKEKATLYTRAKIIEILRNTIESVVYASILVYSNYNKIDLEEFSINVEFGEYATPSFDSQVDVISKAVQNNIMSIDTAIEELYGNSWDIEKKKKEKERIKNERRISKL